MSLEIPTWDKIINSMGSTTTEFGGTWANLISDYFNGVNIGLLDVTKLPIIGTLTRYKFEKMGIYDVDQSHYIIFSADDIDTGANRKIRFRRMNSPYTEDFAVLEGMTQTLLNKNIDSDLNNITNIVDADIKSTAAISTLKLADSVNFLLKNLDNNFGAHFFDISNMTPTPATPSTGDARFFKEVIDSNNDGIFVHIKKNGSFQKVQLI